MQPDQKLRPRIRAPGNVAGRTRRELFHDFCDGFCGPMPLQNIRKNDKNRRCQIIEKTQQTDNASIPVINLISVGRGVVVHFFCDSALDQILIDTNLVFVKNLNLLNERISPYCDLALQNVSFDNRKLVV